MKKNYLAHVHPDTKKPHHLENHLEAVGKFASEFASEFGNPEWAELAGRWHDLGKYRGAFQEMIRQASGYEAHLEEPDRASSGKVDHSTAGALHAIETLGQYGKILAYCIAGHHAGLADWHSDSHRGLQERLAASKELLPDTLRSKIPERILQATRPGSRPPKGADIAFWIRMLFSCLVDADFLDTERFMDEKRFRHRANKALLPDFLQHFDKFMEESVTSSIQDSPVNRIRKKILEECRQKALSKRGFFTLTVPTGGGKTLSSLAFALEHAKQHRMQRVIYVVPYTSIIEQTANVFRDVFKDLGRDTVLEHHSNVDPSHETVHSRLASETWDAPLIVTTAVQFFESIYANRTSRCRKLHNLCNSIIILDEAQLLPVDFLQPCLNALRELKSSYGATIVLCTATQPALHYRKGVGWEFEGLGKEEIVQEIVEDPEILQQKLKRVRFSIPKDLNQPTTWECLAEKLSKHHQVLCVVNKARKDCRELHSLMPSGTLHLSALMCGQHRSEKIDEIKACLKSGKKVRVISTQLVEAGVDLDFPVVYRALAGLDSIAQAAGRCNREGRLEFGKVVVFVPPGRPPESQQAATDLGRELLQLNPEDPLNLEGFTRYFEQLYWARGKDGLDKKQILKLLEKNPYHSFAFRSAAERFQLISAETRSLLVPYKNEELLEQLNFRSAERQLLRKLQRFILNIYDQELQILQKVGATKEVLPGLFLLTDPNRYDYTKGLVIPPPNATPIYEPGGLIQ